MEMSPEIKEIAEALAMAQAEITTASKDKKNPHFGQTYATLASVWEACRAALTKNGIAVVQSPNADGARVTVTTMLIHKSGQWFRDSLTLTARDASPQSIGSAQTYGRRYALSAMVSVAPDDDDDANAAQPEKQAKEKSKAQERTGFDKGVSMPEHEAREAAKPEPRPQQDLGDFEDRIKSCKVASEGKTAAGVAWTLYTIETEGHGAFSTFDAKVYDDARKAVTIGEIVMVQTEPTKKGPKINAIVSQGVAEAA